MKTQSPFTNYSFIGKRFPLQDAEKKIKGEIKYTADLNFA